MKKHDPNQQLFDENLQLKLILNRISDGFVALDSHINYIFVNEAGAKLLGYEPAKLIGKNYWEAFPEAKGTSFANAYVEAF